jgi:hypothetical protein
LKTKNGLKASFKKLSCFIKIIHDETRALHHQTLFKLIYPGENIIQLLFSSNRKAQQLSVFPNKKHYILLIGKPNYLKMS